MKVRLRCIGATQASLKSGMFTANVIYDAVINFKNDTSGSIDIIANSDKKKISSFHFTNNKKLYTMSYLFRPVFNS